MLPGEFLSDTISDGQRKTGVMGKRSHYSSLAALGVMWKSPDRVIYEQCLDCQLKTTLVLMVAYVTVGVSQYCSRKYPFGYKRSHTHVRHSYS